MPPGAHVDKIFGVRKELRYMTGISAQSFTDITYLCIVNYYGLPLKHVRSSLESASVKNMAIVTNFGLMD
jgi:hypothetical protein